MYLDFLQRCAVVEEVVNAISGSNGGCEHFRSLHKIGAAIKHPSVAKVLHCWSRKFQFRRIHDCCAVLEEKSPAAVWYARHRIKVLVQQRVDVSTGLDSTSHHEIVGRQIVCGVELAVGRGRLYPNLVADISQCDSSSSHDEGIPCASISGVFK